jgi:hypothetical protein
VSGSLTQHDAVIFQDNDFEVFIDPDGDNQEYYEFEMNALNTGWDLFLKKAYRDGGPAENSWEIPGLKTAVRVDGTLNNPRNTDKGWTLEIAMPWKALGEFAHRPSPPKEGDQWRISFSRVEWLFDVVDSKYVKRPGTKEDNWVFSPQGLVDMHRPERWGYVQFTTKKPGTVKFQPDDLQPVKDLLHAVYYAQQKRRADGKALATSFEDLEIPVPAGIKTPILLPTVTGWECVALAESHGKPMRLSILQDSKFTMGIAE